MAFTLMSNETEELQANEAIIARGFETFVEVGAALLTIREKRLYRETHGTFEDYCRERWGMSRNHADRLVDAAKVVNNLVNKIPPIGGNSPQSKESTHFTLPTGESQVRPLVGLAPQQQREAWGKAVADSPTGQPTAKVVEAAVREVAPSARPTASPTPAAPRIETPELIFEEPEEEEPEEEVVAVITRPRQAAPVPQPQPSTVAPPVAPPPRPPAQSQAPAPEDEAAQWAAFWNGKLDQWLNFATSLDRRGGIDELAKKWQPPQRVQALEIMRSIVEVMSKSITKLEKLI